MTHNVRTTGRLTGGRCASLWGLDEWVVGQECQVGRPWCELCNQVDPDVVGPVPPLPGNNDSVRGVIIRRDVRHGNGVSEEFFTVGKIGEQFWNGVPVLLFAVGRRLETIVDRIRVNDERTFDESFGGLHRTHDIWLHLYECIDLCS